MTTSPGDYARAVFRAYEALQVGTDPGAIEQAEDDLRAVNGSHPLLGELSRKSTLMRVRSLQPAPERGEALSAGSPGAR